MKQRKGRSKKIYVLAAGGTGGHIIPALAVARALKEKEPSSEVVFVGVGRPAERDLITPHGYNLEEIPFVPLTGGGVLGLFRALFKLPLGLLAAVRVLKKHRVDVVMGFGGYPTFLPFAAAVLMRVPRILHEQNVKVGLANRFLSLFANKVFATFGASGFWRETSLEHVGNPVREELCTVDPWTNRQTDEMLTLLVMGGSQGAKSINEAVLSLVDFFKENNIEVIHISGQGDFENIKQSYEARDFSSVDVRGFVKDMTAVYSRAQLIVARAGAMTVAEILAVERPAIYIPLKLAKAHQADNISALVDRGICLSIEQDVNLANNLRKTLENLIDNPEKLLLMNQAIKDLKSSSTVGTNSNATERIVDYLTNL